MLQKGERTAAAKPRKGFAVNTTSGGVCLRKKPGGEGRQEVNFGMNPHRNQRG
jgi:hypothetical protein